MKKGGSGVVLLETVERGEELGISPRRVLEPSDPVDTERKRPNACSVAT